MVNICSFTNILNGKLLGTSTEPNGLAGHNQ